MDEPLKKYRQRGSQTEGPATPERKAEREPYVAFETSTNEKRFLIVRRAFPKPSHAYSYVSLKKIKASERYGKNISLMFIGPALILVQGRNLQELFGLLTECRVTYIREFDPSECAEPSDPKQPIITNIEVHLTDEEEPPPPNKRH